MARLRVLIIVGFLSIISLRFSSLAIAQQQETGCALSVGGQGYYISGGAGDIATSLPDHVFNFSDATQLIQSLTTAKSEPTAIIIADDFRQFDDSNNGIDPIAKLLSDIQGLSPTEADTMIATEKVPHGYMVQEHFKNLLAANGFSDGGETQSLPSENAFEFYWDKWTSSSGFPLMVVSLDTLDYDTQTIATRITAITDWLKNQQPPITRVVVNMSFSVLPCSIVKEFYESESDIKDFKSYINDAGQSAQLKMLKQWLQDEISNHDFLRQLIVDHYGADFGNILSRLVPMDWVFVASAGNIGIDYPFPLYPGAWPEVINVGATSVPAVSPPSFSDDDVPNILEPYSNPAEVLTYGAYQLPSSTTPTVQYEGTSFAAPIVSLYSALMLSANIPDCPFEHPLPLAAVLPSYDTLPEMVHRDCNLPSQDISFTLAKVIESGSAIFSFKSSDGTSATGNGSLMPNGEIIWDTTVPTTLSKLPEIWAYDGGQTEVYYYDLGTQQKSVYFPDLTTATPPAREVDSDMIVVHDSRGDSPYSGSTVVIR